MNKKFTHSFFASFLICALSSCNSSSSTFESTSIDNTLVGSFVDSPVEGLGYRTATNDGKTNQNGEFDYEAGETVQFSIGLIEFPEIAAAEQLSPYDLSENAVNQAAMVSNIARFVQSIDIDGNTENGISIPQTVVDQSVAINFDVTTVEFESNSDVINIVANSGSPTTALISQEVAMQHLDSTLGISTSVEDLADISGFWDIDDSSDYINIMANGDVLFYDFNATPSCYSTRPGLLTRDESTLYTLNSEGETRQVVITRVGDTLNILLVGSLSLDTITDPTTLPMC